MIGVEVTGLAVVILPILISAAESVGKKRLEPRKAEFMINLAYEIWLLRTCLIKLAKGLTQLPDEIREQLTSPSLTPDLKNQWETEQVARALKAYLGIRYDTFCAMLEANLDCLEQLVEYKSLGLPTDETTRPRYAKLAAIRDSSATTPADSVKSRVRFNLTGTISYEHILARITEDNNRLEKLLEVPTDSTVSTLEPSPQENTAVSASYTELRASLRALHTTLGGLWPCKCHRRREAMLCLLQRHDVRQDSVSSETGPGKYAYFEILVSLRGNDPRACCRWVEIQVCIALQKPGPAEPAKTVRFTDRASPPSLSASASATGNDGVALDVERRRSWEPGKRIEKMCNVLSQADRNLCIPQFLFDGDSLWHMASKASSRRSSRTSNSSSEVAMSLASLLKNNRKLKMKEKRILPVILAHSLLLFCDSPWLSKDWGKEHIHFYSTSGRKDDFDIRRPFLSTKFEDSEQENEEENDAKKDLEFRVHPVPSILALGILLLEIELESCLEDHYTEDVLVDGSWNVNTDYLTALKLFEDVSGSIYINHQRALSACLNHQEFFDFETEEMSWDNEQFRLAVYDRIVRPLELELHAAYELTLDDIAIQPV